MDAFTVDTTANALRECVERANQARRRGETDVYRRHIEEFLFISHAIAGATSGPRTGDQGMTLPHLVVMHDNLAMVDLLREGLLEFGFAALVEPVRSLDVLGMKLDACDADRPMLFVVISQLRLGSGLAAMHRIRAHARTVSRPILVLTLQERQSDAALALGAGASDYALFPDTIEGYVPLIERIRSLLDAGTDRASESMEA
jgi:CheY-like chemotaxis protein